MARVTVEDCIDKIPNRYELLMVAAQRAKDISSGSPLTIDRDNDKNSVVALREIASGKLDVNAVRHEFVQSYKETPAIADGEESLEIGTEDPLLREIDAELENALSDDAPIEDAADVMDEVMADDVAIDEE